MKRIVITRMMVAGCALACLWAPWRVAAETSAEKAEAKAAATARRQEAEIQRESVALAVQEHQLEMGQAAQRRQAQLNGTPADELSLLKQLTSKLKLTYSQRIQVKGILDGVERKLISMNADKALSQQAKDDVRSQQQTQMWASIEALLTPAQLARLDNARRAAFVAGLPSLLNLTGQQSTQVTAVFDREIKPDLLIRENISLSSTQQQERLSDLRETTWTRVTPILTSDQQNKLDSLRLAGKLSRISKAVGLSTDQQNAVEALLKQRDIDARPKSSDQTPAALQAQRETADDTLWAHVDAVLSPDQQTKLATLRRDQMLDHLSNQLDLTSSQRLAVEPVVDASYTQIGKARDNKTNSPAAREEQLKALRAAMWKHIRPILTSSQRLKLDAMNAPPAAVAAVAH